MMCDKLEGQLRLQIQSIGKSKLLLMRILVYLFKKSQLRPMLDLVIQLLTKLSWRQIFDYLHPEKSHSGSRVRRKVKGLLLSQENLEKTGMVEGGICR